MTSANYNLNRPVYLGRRDVFVERAMEGFHPCLKELSVKKRMNHIDATLYSLQSALEPAMMAAKASDADPLEESFILFLRWVLYYLHSARVMMESGFQLDNAESPLRQFLHRTSKTEASLNLARRSEQMLQDISHLFRMAEKPFRELQKKLIEAMNENDRARYTRAYESLRKHSSSRKHAHHALIYGQTFWPTPGMRYE